MAIHIREASKADLDNVLAVEYAAFGGDAEAELVRDLLADPSAKPFLSLLAFQENRAVGHILFTTAHLAEAQNTVLIALLAPLAVVPDVQQQGVGTQLIEKGLQMLSESGIDLVFVLGHPDYYPRHGFKPAGALGFEAPYPILAKNAGAWMVCALRAKIIGSVSGKVVCANALNQAELWQE